MIAQDGEALALLEESLRPAHRGTLAAEQPALFGAGATGTIKTLRESGSAVAAAGLVVRRVVTPRGRATLGLIGCVAVRPDRRGRGLGRRLLAECERTLAEQGCDATLLWADEPAFYARCGYAPAGREIVALLPKLTGFDDGRTRPYEPRDLEAVERLRRAARSSSDRPLAESAQHYASPGTRVLVHGDVDAYAAVGRGLDLHQVIHEWAGDPAGLFAIFERMGPLPLLLSEHDTELIAALSESGVTLHRGPLGMAKGRWPDAAPYLAGFDSI